MDGQDVAVLAGREPRGAGLGLDIGVLDEGGPDCGLGDVLGAAEGGIGVAATDEAACQQVAGAVGVQQGGAGGFGLGRVQQGGQGTPVDGEGLEVERGDDLGRAGDERDGLAAKAGGALGQRRLVGEVRDDAEAVAAGDVGGGQHDVEAVRGAPAFEVAEGEARVVVRRADGADGQPVSIRRPEVGAEDVGAAHLWPAVQAFRRGADGAAAGNLDRRRRVAPGVADGVEDLRVAGAAAEHAAKRFLGLGAARAGFLFQQRGGGHQHPRRADAALGGAVAQEGALQAVQPVGGEALDGGDVAADGGGGRRQAGADRLSVQQHGAGAAVAGVAADLGAGQAQHLAERVREAARRVAGQGGLGAVDRQARRRVVEAHGVTCTARATCATVRRTSSAAACAR